MKLTLSKLASPLGEMLLVTDADGRVRALEFAERHTRMCRNLWDQYGTYELTEGAAPTIVADLMQRYFAGELRALDDVDVATAGTDRQEKAWAALRRIPVTTTVTYGALGKTIGIDDWRAAVDAGAAVGANPVGIIVPCHRVLASNGELKGYAWGLHRKRWLLEHERALAVAPAMPQTASLF
ncbi:MAG: Methylated-DNA--(protein)-cysteine S-methyltransferase [Ramlibacter sp.]|nr:Methylated-DNA--(protein)-cysteine S-methyltransferase [Ramlibacter sp.]